MGCLKIAIPERVYFQHLTWLHFAVICYVNNGSRREIWKNTAPSQSPMDLMLLLALDSKSGGCWSVCGVLDKILYACLSFSSDVQQSVKELLFFNAFPNFSSLCFSMERGFRAVAAEMTMWMFSKQRGELFEMMTQAVFETASNSRLDGL